VIGWQYYVSKPRLSPLVPGSFLCRMRWYIEKNNTLEDAVARTPAIPSLTDLSWLEHLTHGQLTRLAEVIRAEIDKKRAEEKALLREEVLEKTRQYGIDPAELFSHKSRGGLRGEVTAKYRDKRDPTQTWSGRGRVPNWLKERIADGESRDDYLIK
jgi:DNA-binding protein H-NS